MSSVLDLAWEVAVFCNFMPLVVCLISWHLPPDDMPVPADSSEAIPAEPLGHSEWMPELSAPFFTPPICDLEEIDGEIFSAAEFLVDGDAENVEANPTRRLRPAVLSLVGNTSFGAERITAGNRWVKVPYQPFNFNLVLPLAASPDAVRFWLNGLPADPEMLTLSSPWAAIDRQPVSAKFQWQCPSLGKVVMQVEYLIDGTWSPLSRPLRIEVMPQSAPQPIAAGAKETGLILIANPVQPIECLNNVVVKFANLTSGASVIADIAGIGHIQGSDRQNCCYAFDLKSILPVGRYKLTFRQIDSNRCGLSSRSSAPIVVDLSYDPYAEVAIDNDKSFRRYSMLSNSEHLIGESYNSELVWMQRLMREPALRASMSKSQSTWTSAILGFLRPQPLVGPTGAKGTTAAKPKMETLVEAKWLDLLALESKTDLWKKRSQQANELSETLESIESSQDTIRNSFKTSKFVSKIDFDTPTVFASSRKLYTSDGAVAGDLTILEGMRVSVAANGTYRVDFKCIAPRTPAILHLQIQVRSDETSGWKTLTLVPIVIKPIRYDEPDTMVHQIVRDGYSSALERAGGYINQARRRGSAVSGYNFPGAVEPPQF